MRRGRTVRVVAGLIVFGLAFGVVEASVVIDLRAIYEPLHARLHPSSAPDDLFPILTLDDLRAAGPTHLRLLYVELIREAATLVMLASVAMIPARNAREWLAGFLVGFGVWDLAFYGFLRLAIGWPGSLATWDLLFLLPAPWSAPVLAPMLAASVMAIAGLAILVREGDDRPARIGLPTLSGLALGSSAMLFAFCRDARVVAAGGVPGPFAWPVFGVGLGIAVASFGVALRRSDRASA